MDDPSVYLLVAATLIVAGGVYFWARRQFAPPFKIDFEGWRKLAAAKGWSFTADHATARILAKSHGAQVVVNAAGSMVGDAPTIDGLESMDDGDDTLVIGTSIMTPISGAPAGFSVSERSVGSKEGVHLEDEALSKVIVATGDQDKVEAVLARPDVRQTILELVPHGRFSISLDVILLYITGELPAAPHLEALVERIALLAAAIGVPAPGERPTPVPSGAGNVRRPRLGALVSRAQGSRFGGPPAEDIQGRQVVCQMQLDTVQLLQAVGPGAQEVMLLGSDIHGTSKIDVKARVSTEDIRRMVPGTLVSVEGVISRFDGRDRVELTADAPLGITENPEPSAKHRREAAFASMADQVGMKSDLSPLVEVMYAAASTRARLLVHIDGREYVGPFVPTKSGPVRDDVPPIARGGTCVLGRVGKRDVEVVVPPGVPEPNGDIKVSIVRWDDAGGRPVMLLV